LQVICEPDGEVPAVWADRVAVAVVADNLLSNALKHSRPGGAILVQLVTGPGGVVCSIRDNGPGPDPVAQAQLIQNGLLIGTGAAPDRAPSGYGLSIARDLLARMDGQLRFEVTEGGGTCFSFRLPYASQGAASRSEAEPS
jgi:signal transduction histidine kinase